MPNVKALVYTILVGLILVTGSLCWRALQPPPPVDYSDIQLPLLESYDD